MPMATFSSDDAIQNPYLAAAAKSEGINYVLVTAMLLLTGAIIRGNGATKARIPRSWFNDPAVKSYLRASKPFIKSVSERTR
jgi:hypothetical protein